jgi:DNA-binding MarR family transcriptional regulator
MTKSEYETLAEFRYELRKFLHFSERAAAGQDLAPQQYLALLEIKGFPERERVTVGELAERLQITAHSAVGLVNRLEERGFVKRESCEQDRRCVYVSLTREGDKVLEKLASVHRVELKKVGPLLVKLLGCVTGTSDSEE